MRNQYRTAAARSRAGAEPQEGAGTARMAEEAKKAAAKAPREMALLRSPLLKLEGLKTRADADVSSADKVLAAAKTDEDRARAEDFKQKASANAADLATQLDAARADAKPKLDVLAATKDAA